MHIAWQYGHRVSVNNFIIQRMKVRGNIMWLGIAFMGRTHSNQVKNGRDWNMSNQLQTSESSNIGMVAFS